MLTQRRTGAAAACLVMGLVIACLLAASNPASATTLRRMDLSDLVSHSNRVVHARTVSNNVYWDPTHTRIYTDTVFEAIGEAKGAGPKRLTVTQLGGRIDPIEMLVEGTPAFTVGEEVVLFTEPNPEGNQMIVGLSQGVMRVKADPRSGARFAVSEVPTKVTFVGGRPQRAAVALDELFEQVRQLAGGLTPPGAAGRRPATDPVKPGGGKP